MQRGSKEFYEVADQFEKDLLTMPVYVGAKAVRASKDHKITGLFYENGKINDLFYAYMNGYQLAKCIYQNS